MQKHKQLFIAAAGSGGHILPALVVAQAWRTENTEGAIWFFASTRSLDRVLTEQATGINRTIHFSLEAFSLKRWWKLPLLCLQLAMSFLQSFWLIVRYRPEKIITTGGLVGLPLCIAGWILRVPIELYELNAVPGKAVKALMPFAQKIYTPFAQAACHCTLMGKNFAHKCEVVPYPLRFNDTSLSASKEKNVFEINAKLGEGIFSVHKKSLVIVGGSQGSAFLNKAIQHALETDPVLSKNVQIIHQAGGLQKERCNAWYQERRIAAYVFDFDAQIERYYQLADLVICRAGAGTLFELVHFNKRALVVPLVASTTAHQKDNAYAIAELYPHFFTVIEQQQLEMRPDLLAHHLRLGLGC